MTPLALTRARSAPAIVIAIAIAGGVPTARAAPTPDDDVSPVEMPEDEDVPVAVAPARESIVAAPLAGAQRLDAEGLFVSEQQAYKLYMEGVHAFEDAEDPDTAIDKWEEALRVLPDERPYARSRGALALRLVTAHEMRFFRDGELSDMRRQASLLLGYQQRLPEMFPDDAAARKTRHDHTQVRIDEINDELDRIEGDHGTTEDQLDKSLRGEYHERGADTWRPDASDAGWHARPDDPRKAGLQGTDQEVAPEEEPVVEDAPPPKKEGTALIVSGAAIGVLGLAGLGVGVAGMVTAAGANEFDEDQTPSDRRAQIARGSRGNTQAVVGLAAGGALTIVGVALLATGAKKRRRPVSQLGVTPTFDRRFVGATIRGRF